MAVAVSYHSNFKRSSMKALFKFLAVSTALITTAASANFANIGTSTTLDANGFSTPVHLQGYEDLPAYLVTVAHGKLTPATLVVPAGQKFRLVIRNAGTVPAEFESNQLRFEKVMYMGTQNTVLILPLSPGTYDYYDDFTPNGDRGKIVVVEKK